MPTVREVEDKYAVGIDFAFPDLGGLSGVDRKTEPETVELSATYLDTADHRLVRNRITLRRRTGGHDAGWHLKLPATGGRDEVQRPLGNDADQPPDELRDLVLARTRGAALAPVARLDTRRTIRRLIAADGRVLAEVADDEVTARVLDEPGAEPLRWREVEVELVDGDLRLLTRVGKRLRAAGAEPSASGSKIAFVLGDRLEAGPDPIPPKRSRRPVSAGEVVRAYLAEHLTKMLEADPRVRLDEPDAVHRMRVATRRLRSTLRTFRTVLDEDRAVDLDARLKDLAGVLGVPRDREVQLERLNGRLERQPDELVLGPVRRHIDERLTGERLAGLDEVRTTLRGEAYLTLVDDLLAFLDDGVGTAGRRPARSVVPRLVRKRYRRLDARLAAARAAAETERDQRLHDVRLHEARKAAKQVRYAAETVERVYGKDARRLAKRVERVQEVLGEHQDSVVLQPLLRELAVGTHGAADESAFTYGLLTGLEQAAAADARARLEDVWAEASRRRYRRFLH